MAFWGCSFITFCLSVSLERKQKYDLGSSSTLTSFEDEHRELYAVMRWGIQASNAFFRIVYCGRLWLDRAEGQALASHGWNMLESLLQQMLIVKYVCHFLLGQK